MISGKNLVIVSGYIGQDIELKTTASGKTIVTGTLGVPHGYGETKKTIWVRFEAWENPAKFLSNWGRKGSAMTLVGRLDLKEWQEDDKRRSAMVVIVDQAEFALAGKENPRPASTPWRANADGSGPAFKPEEAPKQATFTDEDDLPF